MTTVSKSISKRLAKAMVAMVALSLAVAGLGGTAGAGGKVTGEPVKIGVITSVGVSGIDLPTLEEGAQAAAEYVTKELGGIAGRPVEAIVCNDKSDPAQDAVCAQKFIDEGVIAITGLGPTWGDNGLPITAAANIPFVGLPISNAEFINPSSYPMTGGSASAFPALAKYFLDKGVKKAAIIYADLAAGKLAADALLGDPLIAGGVEVVAIPEKVGAPDFTPAVVQANAGDPDVIFMLFSGPDCVRILQAAGQVGVNASMAGAGSCVEEKTFDEVDDSIVDGAIFNSDTAYFVKNDPEAKTYRKALKKYEKAAPSGFSATTFATIMTLKTIGDELGDGLSAQAVLDTLKNADGIPVFLAQPMNKADAATLAGVPINIYNPWQRIVRLKNGKVVDANDNEWIRG